LDIPSFAGKGRGQPRKDNVSLSLTEYLHPGPPQNKAQCVLSNGVK